MRSAIAVAVGFALWPGSTAPREADASTPAPPSGAVAASAAVASPESAAIAYLLAPGRLRVRVPGVATRDYAIPPDCEPQALARDAVFLGCYPLLELRLADGALTPVTVALDPLQSFSPSRAGDAWIGGVLRRPSSSGKDIEERAIVSRVDGTLVNLDVGFGAAPPGWGRDRYVDLSSPRPLRLLCRPLGREPAADAFPVLRARLMKVGPWTLRQVAYRRLWWIQRCGSTRVVRAGRWPILGPGHVAWMNRRAGRRVVRLRDLVAGTARSIALPRLSSGLVRPVIAFTSDRLVVSQPAPSEQGRTRWAVRTIPLD